MNIESKSYLAKLLATEDIAIEHANVPTAAFDLKSRKIILPNWKDMPDFLYDLLIGHEVGHGLVTPPEGWHDAICSQGAGFKSFLNVIEDARNERLVKQRYPGLVKSFYKAYRYLFEKDFFGVGDTDVNTLSFIDRINLHYKIGSFLNVQFSDAERETLARIDVAEEWGDVVDIATSIYDGALEEMQDQQPEDQAAPANGEDDSEEAEGQSSSTELSDDAEDTDGPTEGEGQSGDADGEESDDVEQSPQSSSADAEQSDDESDAGESGDPSAESGTPTENSSEESVSEPMSQTDQSFRQNEERLLENDSERVFTAHFPKFINHEKTVMSVSKTWDFDWKIYKNHYEPISASEVKHHVKTLSDNFRNKNKSAINQLVMQFEMKRKALELRKAKVNNTGKLNEDKLWAYKLTEDLFLSNTVLPSGKNHGMFMIIDFSGSMAQHMAGTIEQLLIQVAFCKKVGIPFDVYGFTSQMNESGIVQSSHENEVFLHRSTGLVQLITSESLPAQYKKSFENLLVLSDCWSTFTYRRHLLGGKHRYVSTYDLPSHLQLGSTPLASAIMIATDVAKEFKERNHIEVMNTIVLSDGGNTDEYLVCDNADESGWSKCKTVNATKLILKRGTTSVMVRHPKSVYQSKFRTALSREVSLIAGLAMYKKITGSRMVNFWICSKKKSDARNAWQWVTLNEMTWNEPEEFVALYKSQWIKKDYMAVDSAWGYDQTFLIKGGSGLQVNETELDIKSQKKSDVMRGFREFQSKKSNSRHFINRFVDMVA